MSDPCDCEAIDEICTNPLTGPDDHLDLFQLGTGNEISL
jgi:hypothetical protein